MAIEIGMPLDLLEELVRKEQWHIDVCTYEDRCSTLYHDGRRGNDGTKLNEEVLRPQVTDTASGKASSPNTSREDGDGKIQR